MKGAGNVTKKGKSGSHFYQIEPKCLEGPP